MAKDKEDKKVDVSSVTTTPDTKAGDILVNKGKERVEKSATGTKKVGLHWANYVIIGILILGATFIGLQTSAALKSSASDSTAGLTPESTLPALPELKLNKNHARQGPTVEVNQGEIGRENPFLKP